MSATSEGSKVSRPRNPEATKELLIAAATEEFSEYGFAGARIDRISQRARTNKRMIYAYFGDKDGLFDVVLKREIGRLAEAVPLEEGNLTAFAVSRFDYMLANPDTRRLAGWRTFERSQPTAAETESYRVKVEAVAAAQRAGRLNDAIPAIDLFATVLRMTESWLSAPPALHAAGDADPMTPDRIAEHRAALAEAVRRITEPAWPTQRRAPATDMAS
ncbi:TetR family transcriptional regulator [Streptomyces sp. NPDC101225]|uniref:TetR family transcriptional regulator n=1 Tax=Streptomyces sp. NPDC101225 TaxID=3366135 RepID=UPI003813846B